MVSLADTKHIPYFFLYPLTVVPVGLMEALDDQPPRVSRAG